MKAYCDTLGLTSIETSAVVSQYEKLDKAISSAEQNQKSSGSGDGLLDYIYKTFMHNSANNMLEMNQYTDKYGMHMGMTKYNADKAAEMAGSIANSVVTAPVTIVMKAVDGIENIGNAIDSAIKGNWSEAGKYFIRGTVDLASFGSDVALIAAAFATGGSSILVATGIKLTVIEGVGSGMDFTFNIDEKEYGKALGNIGDIIGAFFKAKAFGALKGTGNS